MTSVACVYGGLQCPEVICLSQYFYKPVVGCQVCGQGVPEVKGGGGDVEGGMGGDGDDGLHDHHGLRGAWGEQKRQTMWKDQHTLTQGCLSVVS